MHSVSTTAVIVVEWILLAICLCLILALVYLRLHLEHKRFILGDYFACLAFLCGVWSAALDLELRRVGWLSPSNMWSEFESNMNTSSSTQKLVFVSWFPLLTILYLNKAALLSYLFYIFPSTLGYIFYPLWAVTIFSGLAYITSILLVFLGCLPHQSAKYNFTFCGINRQYVLWTVTWALHLSSDIFIFIVPLTVLRNLRLNWKKKIGLYATFGCGVFSISACLVRFLIVQFTFPEVSTTTLELWCALDAFFGLIVACLPALRPYLNLR